MLLVPYAVGVALAGPTWSHLPLLVGWLAGYLLSYYALLAVKTRRPARVRDQLRLYSTLAAPALLLVVLARPVLLWAGPVFAVLLAVSAWYAWRRDERSVVNDLAGITQGTLMIPVAALTGGLPATATWPAWAVTWLYFAGTAFYVKTMIRERGQRSWWLASVGYHVAAAVAAVAVAATVVGTPAAATTGVLFSWLAVRAAVLPRFPLTPKQVGILEIVHSVVLLVVVTVAPGLTAGR